MGGIRSEQDDPSSSDRLNYFNYFTEVEEEFVRRRGKPLFISPLDWALVESWKNSGIPLHIVLRAINKAFDGYDKQPRTHRRVNSIFYCEQEVEAGFAEYRLAHVGESLPGQEADGDAAAEANQETHSEAQFTRESVVDFIARIDRELGVAESRNLNRRPLVEALDRCRRRLNEIRLDVESAPRVNGEALERDFDAIDRLLVDSVAGSLDAAETERIAATAKRQMKPYRKKMDGAIYDTTLKNFVNQQLREVAGLPRISLFYL